MFATGKQADSGASRPGSKAANGVPPMLVIDDAKVHRMIICRIAEKAGLDFVEAESCAAVVSVLPGTSYCGATLDLSLGERTGTEVLIQLARDDFRPPIIIISGSDPRMASEAQEIGIALGLNMHEPLPKPLDLAKLRRRFVEIRETFNRGQRP